MTPFMASIEATKRAFGEAETARRRRHRNNRDREKQGAGSGSGSESGAASESNTDAGRDGSRQDQDGASSGGVARHGTALRLRAKAPAE